MAIPKFQDFLYPFLLQLRDKDVSNKEMKDILIKHFSLTEEDCLMKTKGGSAFQIDDRIGWARQWLRRALFIEIPQKGIYRITQRGKDYLNRHSDLREKDLLEYPEYAEYANPSKEKKSETKIEIEPNAEELTPTEQLEAAMKKIVDDLAADILQKAALLDRMIEWGRLEEMERLRRDKPQALNGDWEKEWKGSAIFMKGKDINIYALRK